MKIPPNHSLHRSLRLRDPTTALQALGQLANADLDQPTLEALVELIHEPPSSQAAVAAIQTLSQQDSPIVLDAFCHALEHASIPCRIRALQLVSPARVEHFVCQINRLLRRHGSWLVRREAVIALAQSATYRWNILYAASDPHWRVRHTLVQQLIGEDWQSNRSEIQKRMQALAENERVFGVLEYLRYRWSGIDPRLDQLASPTDPSSWCDFWDWDPAVLCSRLRQMKADELWQRLELMPRLAGHDDERVRKFARQVLQRQGHAGMIAETMQYLEEPRHGSSATVEELLPSLNLDQVEEVVDEVLNSPEKHGSKAILWSIDQIGDILPTEEFTDRIAKGRRSLNQRGDQGSTLEPTPSVDSLQDRCRLAKELAVAPSATAQQLAKLEDDPHPYVRAAALTESRARHLVENPADETSWFVLAEAARKSRVPLWKLKPDNKDQLNAAETPLTELTVSAKEPSTVGSLGAAGLSVSRIGISGHYGLPVEGFVEAIEAGVNFMFWEPNYHTMRQFFARLPASQRNAIHVVAGTFEADPKRIRQDLERALRTLKIDQLALFLIFWVRSWNRISDEVRRLLDQLQVEGKVRLCSLSTHSRSLAVQAIDEGWNPIMVRHSAAHRGAETEILPKAAAMGTSIITFNSTCYRRLLRPVGDDNRPPTAADCYRYTLGQAGVTACWSAPATLEQLDENLAALSDPFLSAEQRESMRQFGAIVYREDKVFEKCIRAL